MRGRAARAEHVRVITVGEHAAMPALQRIEPLCQADPEALHGAREIFGAPGLDDEMQVIAKDCEMHDAHAKALAGFLQPREHDPRPPPGAQMADAGLHPHRDVHGMPRGERRPLEVRHTRTDQASVRSSPGPPCPRSPATPAGQSEFELTSHVS